MMERWIRSDMRISCNKREKDAMNSKVYVAHLAASQSYHIWPFLCAAAPNKILEHEYTPGRPAPGIPSLHCNLA